LGFRKPRKRFLLDRESVELAGSVVKEGEAGVVAVPEAAAAACVPFLSSGCRSGRAVAGLLLLASSASWAAFSSSSNPISPRFRGRGPACGRDSGAAVEEEAELEDESMNYTKVGLGKSRREKERKGIAPGKD
jgi:hypothetical protein